MPTTTAADLVVGSCVTIRGGSVRWEVTQPPAPAIDDLVRIWPMDRDDERDGRWEPVGSLVLVEPVNAGAMVGEHIDNGFGYCKACRVSMVKADHEPDCDDAGFEVI